MSDSMDWQRSSIEAAASYLREMIEAGANRIGSSSGVAIVHELGAPEFRAR